MKTTLNRLLRVFWPTGRTQALTCRGQQERATLFLDERLSQNDRTQFVAHTKECPACQKRVSSGTQIHSLLSSYARDFSQTSPSSDFDFRFRARLNREMTDERMAHPLGWPLMALLNPRAVLAGGLAIFFTFGSVRFYQARLIVKEETVSLTQDRFLMEASLASARMDEEEERARGWARELIADTL